MPKRGTSSSYFEDRASLEAKRQQQSTKRQERYLRREKRKAIALMREERRVRLALDGYIDVFKLLSRDDLNTLEISHRKFHSIVTKHMRSVCFIAVDIARVEQLGGYIVLDRKWMFRAIDESHTDPAPVWQKHFRANFYVLLERVASKCLIKRMLINYVANIDAIACKALIAIQPNVEVVTFGSRHMGAIAYNVALDVVHSALFGFPSVCFAVFDAPYEVFTGRGIEQAKQCEFGKVGLYAPIDQSRYHDDDLISLLSVGNHRESMFNLKGLRVSSEFFMKVVKPIVVGRN